MFFCVLYIVIFAALLYGFLKLDCNPLLALYVRFWPNKDKLRNKTIWVIGASTGIGEQLAYQLAKLNCRLILTSSTRSKLDAVKENCLKKSTNLKSDDILVLDYDISDFKQNDTAFEKIVEKFGNVDIIVNNAARIFTSRIFEDDFELTRKLMDVNYFSHIYITKIVIKHWLKLKSKGQILVTSSVGGYFDFPFFSSYTASKRALNAFYRDVALQHSCNGITVSLVMPGPVSSDLTKKSFEINKRKTKFGDHGEMATKRCSELMIIALANKLNESWLSIQPMLLLTYISHLFDYQIHFFCRLINVARIAEKQIL